MPELFRESPLILVRVELLHQLRLINMNTHKNGNQSEWW